MFNNYHKNFGYMASLGFQDWAVEDIVKGLADLGYSYVEWTLAHFDPRKDKRELSKLVKLPESHGMAASEIVIQQDFVTKDRSLFESRLSLVSDSIKAASEIGVHTINLFTGPAPWDPLAPRLGIDLSEGQAWKMVLEAFSYLLPLAEKGRVFLAIEPVFGHLCHEYYSTQELLRQFDSEYLAINLDPSHLQLYGNDIPWVIEQWAPRIKHVHLKDVVGKPGMVGKDFTFPLLGEGTVDWAGFTKSLDGIGYRGALSVEFEAFGYFEKVLKGDPIKAAALSMEQITCLIPS
jgi:sugar phosphate isomerase/epimerase